MKKTKYNDLIGKSVGDFVVIKNIGKVNKWNIDYFLVKCKKCGKNNTIAGANLVRYDKVSHRGCPQHKEIRICKRCGKKFQVYISSHKIFCSVNCTKVDFHGLSMYRRGCKCQICRSANSVHTKKYS